MSELRFYPNHSKLRKWFEASSWLLIPIVSGLWVARQFSSPHFASCVSDDGILQMSWVRQFSQLLAEGVWLPRWLPDSNGGYGSPVFIFYSPLIYYVSAFVYWLTGSVVFSMKLVRWMGLCLSGFAMLPYARRFASRQIALIVALVYLSLPFHVLDISYWSLYAGTWAWIWFPLILLFLDRILTLDPNPTLALCSFSFCYAGLVLTHLVSAYLFSVVILAYVVFHLRGPIKARVVWRSVLGVLLGVGVAAYFLWPAIIERPLVHLEYSTLLPEFNFRNTFLFFPDPILMSADSFLARTIPLLRWIALLQVSLVLVSLAIILKIHEKRSRARKAVIWAGGTALGCLFLMSRPSAWIWDLLPGLPQVQFSTRWMSILTLASALAIGLAMTAYPETSPSTGIKWLKLSHFSLCLGACFFSVVIVMSGCFLGEDEEKLAIANFNNAPEYNPKVMPNWKQRTIETRDPVVAVLQGNAQIRVNQWQAQSRRIHVDAEGPVRLRLRLFNYPGWVIKGNNGRLTPTDDSCTGGMVIDLDPGLHDLHVEFTETWWRRISLLVSMVTVLTLIVGQTCSYLQSKEISNPIGAEDNLKNKGTH